MLVIVDQNSNSFILHPNCLILYSMQMSSKAVIEKKLMVFFSDEQKSLSPPKIFIDCATKKQLEFLSQHQRGLFWAVFDLGLSRSHRKHQQHVLMG